jgi:hypothetical protein
MYNLDQQDSMIDYSASGKNRWPAINHFIELTEANSEEDLIRKRHFSTEMCNLLDKLQENANNLSNEQKSACGARGIIVDIVLKVNMELKEVTLDQLYKYSSINIHLFEEISEILRHNFHDFTMIIPTLKGYQLADEISRHLYNVELECLYLKGDTHERFVVGNDLAGITFEGILWDTKRHYNNKGGIKRIEQRTKCGSDISMFYNGKGGEEEVLWMEVRARLID